ncbi:MAG: lytic transglycosylase domain-containing protein [Alphaproteobacteria bacterium]
MDLVTLFAACALASGMPQQLTLCPVRIAHVSFAAWNAMDQWEPLIAESSRRFGVPESWIRSVMRAESGGQTMLDGRPITSRAGAMGLMQVMPETYEEMRLQLGLGGDPYDPHDNVLAGAAYLREMYDRYGYPGFLAAYNAGPERYDDYLIRGRALPQETLNYLAAISPNLRDIVLSQGPFSAPSSFDQPLFGRTVHIAIPSGASLFFALSSGSGEQVAASQTISDEAHAPCQSGPLFVPLHASANGELSSAMARRDSAVRAHSQRRHAPSGDLPVSHGKARVVVPNRDKAP